MAYSRISRIEEKRTRKQLFLVIAGIVVVVFLVITLAIPLLVRVSAFLGNLKSNQPISDTTDKTAPFPPTLAPVPESTNSATLKLEGYSEADTTLKIFVNGDEAKKVLVGSDGAFSFNDISLREGSNTIYATATDKAGNESSKSKELSVNFNKNAPKIEITQPTEGQNFGKNQQEIVISGKTDKGADLRINDRFVFVHDDGTFTLNLKLNDGDNTLTAVVTDAAGNQTKLERHVSFHP